MKKIEKLAFIINRTKPGAIQLGEQLADLAWQHGTQTKLTDAYPITEGYLEGQDACCVVGGDGTLLSVVSESIRWQVPVFGVNRGKLGFLATYSAHAAEYGLGEILQGHYAVNYRSVIQCMAENGRAAIALNDVVFKSADASHLIGLRVTCGKKLVTDYHSDGLAFCTPTGSTAYNLSAGGPIVMPGANVLTRTPICPHSLTQRSVVFPGETELKIHMLQNTTPLLLSLDGLPGFKEHHAFPYAIKIGNAQFPLLQPHELSYFKILRNKLKWGENDYTSPS